MSTIPYGVVRARRVTGGLLLVISVATVVATIVLIGFWLNSPPPVHPLSQTSTVPTAASTPTTVSQAAVAPSASPHDQLLALRSGDAAAVAAIPDGSWVPQLASNRPGTDSQGVAWADVDILNDHLARRTSYGAMAALVWSGDFATFKANDYWVTIMPSAAAGSAEEVLAWCASKGIDRDHCYAKRISTSSPYTGDNTKHQS